MTPHRAPAEPPAVAPAAAPPPDLSRRGRGTLCRFARAPREGILKPRKPLEEVTVNRVLAVGLVTGLFAGCGPGAAPELAASRDDGTLLEVTPPAGPAYRRADGTKYKDRGGERELEVQIEDVRRLGGKTLSVFVGGGRTGEARVNSVGDALLERNSDLGQRVPAVRGGTRVEIKTPAGTRVVSGSF